MSGRHQARAGDKSFPAVDNNSYFIGGFLSSSYIKNLSIFAAVLSILGVACLARFVIDTTRYMVTLPFVYMVK